MAIPKIFKTILTGGEKKTAPVGGPPGSGQKRMPEGTITKKKEDGKGLFGSKPFINRYRLRQELKKSPAHVPGGGSFSYKQRLGLEEELFPKRKFGIYITPYEANRRLRQLKKEVFHARTAADKIALRRRFRFLERLKGPTEKQNPNTQSK